jgi:hypothetical protein
MTHCQTCGAVILSPPIRCFQRTDLVVVNRFREVNSRPAPGVILESSPQLAVRLSVVRNGGPEDPICEGCIRLGLEHLRAYIGMVLDGGCKP